MNILDKQTNIQEGLLNMVLRGVYTPAEEKMLEEWKTRAERLVGWLGETPSDDLPYPVTHRTATRDLMLHMAFIADYKNPIWRDENYARNHRWGGLIAPPFFEQCILGCGGPFYFLEPAPETGIVVSIIIGEYFEFFKPIYLNDSFKIWCGPAKIEDITRPGEQNERRFKSMSETKFINQRDEVVTVYHKTEYTTILPPGSDPGDIFRPGAEYMPEKYKPRMKFTKTRAYTSEDLAAINRMYDEEEIRGAKIRYWEDVQPGEELKPVVIGPITTADQVQEFVGVGLMAPPTIEARRQMSNRVTGGMMVDPETNISLHTYELHMSEPGAKMAGFYSMTIVQTTIEHFLGRLITNWMGDDGFLKRFHWIKLLNTPIGDTIFGRGRVVKKYIDENGEYLVDLDTWLETIRGYISNVGPATVRLLSKEKVLGHK
jgi:hypothetical protein